jgi:hypothetical protein
MICMVCGNDLKDCTCPNLLERLESILDCPHVPVDREYEALIRARAEKNESERTVIE